MKVLILFASVITLCVALQTQKAEVNKFPYQVAISQANGSKGPYSFCGGSLIGQEWVLTAAHCVADHDSVIVGLGSNNRLQPAVKYTIPKEDFNIHPKFVRFPVANDIALIKIPHTDYSENIRNIQLPPLAQAYSSYEGEKVVASGWGFETKEPADIFTDLRWENFDVIGNDECNRFYSFFGIPPDMMCIDTSDKVSPCTGDSGSPLVLAGHNIQIGVSSYGCGEGFENSRPAVFTRLTSFLEWIWQETGISY